LGGRALERQRSVAKHALQNHTARHVSINPVLRNEVRGIHHDGVGILHHLEMLVAVVLPEPHGVSDNLEHVDDAERPVAFVRAQFAVIGVINCDKGIDARRSCGFKLFELNLAFICGQRRARGALEPYGWHIEFNDLDAWNGAQQVSAASTTPATPDACAAPRVVAKGRFASKRKLSTLARAHNSHLWEQLFALPRLELDPDTLEAVRRTGINLDGMRCLRR
jgi:hypothetical protein